MAHKCGITPLQRPVVLVDAADDPAGSMANLQQAATGAGVSSAANGGGHGAFGAGGGAAGNGYVSSSNGGAHGGGEFGPSRGLKGGLGLGGGVKFSVLNLDGSVSDNVLKGFIVPKIMTGEVECAITGAAGRQFAYL